MLYGWSAGQLAAVSLGALSQPTPSLRQFLKEVVARLERAPCLLRLLRCAHPAPPLPCPTGRTLPEDSLPGTRQPLHSSETSLLSPTSTATSGVEGWEPTSAPAPTTMEGTLLGAGGIAAAPRWPSGDNATSALGTSCTGVGERRLLSAHWRFFFVLLEGRFPLLHREGFAAPALSAGSCEAPRSTMALKNSTRAFYLACMVPSYPLLLTIGIEA